MAKPLISEATLQKHAAPNSVSRGEDYFRQRAVIDLVQRGSQIQAQVEGTEVTPYRVTLQTDAGGITQARCTCPYDYEGWCKHIVATILTCLRQPESLEFRPTLTQLLNRLNPEQTQQLVQELVTKHPELIEAVDRYVLLLSHPQPPTKDRKKRRSTLDVTLFRRQVKHILQEGLRWLEDGYEDDPFTDALLKVLEKAQAFAVDGDGENAIASLEAITTACADEWDDLADYGGDSFPIAEALDAAWAEAILSSDISQPQIVDLRVMLETRQDTMSADFSMSLAALEQGWDDPQLKRALQGNGYSDPEHLECPFASQLAAIRLQILERQNRHQEYLNLALAEGLILQYLTYLVQMGDIDLVMAAAQERMSTAEEAFALAQALRNSNHPKEALTIAQTGLTLPGLQRYELANWTAEFSEGFGNPALALEASILAFTLQPSLAEYQRAQALADTQWKKVKLKLLKALRQFQSWGAEWAKVEIFLHEGLIEDAIQTVQASFYPSDLVLRVMQAALPTHPEWVIETAQKAAEDIMNRGKADRYQDAIQWLTQVKAAHAQLNRHSEWMSYFNQLKMQHGRKRKLMDLFKVLH